MSNRTMIWTGSALLLACFVSVLTGCNAARLLPATQGDINDVRSDYAASAQAAEDGNLLRTLLTGGSGLLGSILVSMGLIRRKDSQPFVGTVNGRSVTATEDELVAVVEAARAAKPGEAKN